MTVRRHADTAMTMVPFAMNIPSGPHFWETVSHILSVFPQLSDAGLIGHFAALSTEFPFRGALEPGVYGTAWGNDAREVRGFLHRLNATVQEKWSEKTFVRRYTLTCYGSFLKWFDAKYEKGSTGGSTVFNSRHLSKEILSKPELLSLALSATATDMDLLQAHPVAGKSTARATPREGSNSVHPA